MDRILVKGVVLYADVVISVADIPLIGINLRAAIAGITTMLDYGMLQDWDEEIRQKVLQEKSESKPELERVKTHTIA